MHQRSRTEVPRTAARRPQLLGQNVTLPRWHVLSGLGGRLSYGRLGRMADVFEGEGKDVSDVAIHDGVVNVAAVAARLH